MIVSSLSMCRSETLEERISVTHRSVNHPFGLNQAFVCVGPGGINMKEQSPTRRVIHPSMRKRYRQPALPPTPRRRKMPVAMKAPAILEVVLATKKKASLIGTVGMKVSGPNFQMQVQPQRLKNLRSVFV